MVKKLSRKKQYPVFNAAHYQSNDGMLTTVWGPPMWHYLHTMSFNYPVHPSPKDKQHYRHFVLSLQWVLPCGKCRKNLTNTFHKMPLHISFMKSRATFSKYIYDLHEKVNKMLNKNSGLTYEQVRERYEHFRSRCSRKTRRVQKEKGCTEPLTGEKSKCVLHIVPRDKKCETFQMDKNCEKVRILMDDSNSI